MSSTSIPSSLPPPSSTTSTITSNPTTTSSYFRRRRLGRAASPPTWACYEQIQQYDDDGAYSDSSDDEPPSRVHDPRGEYPPDDESGDSEDEDEDELSSEGEGAVGLGLGLGAGVTAAGTAAGEGEGGGIGIGADDIDMDMGDDEDDVDGKEWDAMRSRSGPRQSTVPLPPTSDDPAIRAQLLASASHLLESPSHFLDASSGHLGSAPLSCGSTLPVDGLGSSTRLLPTSSQPHVPESHIDIDIDQVPKPQGGSQSPKIDVKGKQRAVDPDSPMASLSLSHASPPAIGVPPSLARVLSSSSAAGDVNRCTIPAPTLTASSNAQANARRAIREQKKKAKQMGKQGQSQSQPQPRPQPQAQQDQRRLMQQLRRLEQPQQQERRRYEQQEMQVEMRRQQQRRRQPSFALRPILTIQRSQGFVWNQDLFVPPYIKDRYIASTSPPNSRGFISTSASSANSALTDYEVEVVEIRIEEGEVGVF